MGCPFPLMTGKHKGSGILPYPAEVEALLKELVHYPELGFSVKMRLGWECADEWRPLLPLLNAAPLRRIVLHPRIGKQQYKGEVDLAAFTAFYEECVHPLVYNGDLLTVEDIRKVDEEFPRLEGVMLGRGLLANPALAWEYANGAVFSPDELHEKVKALHARLLQYYEAHLQGEVQLLSKMKPYWEYLLPDADRKIGLRGAAQHLDTDLLLRRGQLRRQSGPAVRKPFAGRFDPRDLLLEERQRPHLRHAAGIDEPHVSRSTYADRDAPGARRPHALDFAQHRMGHRSMTARSCAPAIRQPSESVRSSERSLKMILHRASR